MRYFLITILSLLFFSSFKTVQPEGVCDTQLEISDSCRLSKIYRNDEICHIYHYDHMKKIIRIDTYELFFKNTKGTISNYVEFKYDNFGRMIELSAFNGQKDNFHCWTKRKFIYAGNILSEVEVYKINYKTKKLKLISIRKHNYNSKGQLVKTQCILGEKKKRRKKKKEIIYALYEFKYDDNNNPILIEEYKVDEDGLPFLNCIEEREYDTFPNLQYNVKEMGYFPLEFNNLIYQKKSKLNNNDTWTEFEKEFDYGYNDLGFISNYETKKEYNSGYHLFEYEYICD